MRNTWKIIIVLILAASVAAVVVLKKAENRSEQPQTAINNSDIIIYPPQTIQPQETANNPNNPLVMTIEVVEPPVVSHSTPLRINSVEPKKLPTMVDLGADKCIPCKMMIPVLEELSKEYKDKLKVEFYDVWKNPAYGQQYNVRLIPTQIFLDPNGKELFRHEGFFSKKDILAKWKKLGFEIKETD